MRKNYLSKFKDEFLKYAAMKKVKSALAFVICAAIVLNIIPLSVFTPMKASAENVYPVPSLVNNAIDGGRSSDPNGEWYDNAVAGVGDTADNPYEIKNGYELAYLATLVNSGTNFNGKYIKLVGSPSQDANIAGNVIDIINIGGLLYQSSANSVGFVSCSSTGNMDGWIPIGDTSSHAFQGTVFTDEADGIDIYNLSRTTTSNTTAFGLFGYVGANANISGINLKNVQIMSGNSATSTASAIGCLAGIVDFSATISDCTASGITPGERTHASTIGSTQYSYYIVPDFTITNSYFETNNNHTFIDKNTQYNTAVGGIIGMYKSSSTPATSPELSDCKFTGNIYTSSKYGTGGIVGRIENHAKTITDCDVDGFNSEIGLYIEANNAYGIGGFVGTITGNANIGISNIARTSSSTVSIVSNKSNSSRFFYKAGGIVGQIGGVATAANTGKITITNVGNENLGYILTTKFEGSIDTVNGRGKDGDGSCLASAVGYLAATEASITNCYLKITGDIQKTANSTTNNSFYFGGVIGRGNYSTNTVQWIVDNCKVVDSYFREPSGCTQQTPRMAVGGIIGGITYTPNNVNVALPNSAVRNCTVQNFSMSCDGFAGGIVGIGFSNDGCAVSEISGCTVDNLNITLSNAGANGGEYFIVGGITPKMKDGTISNCKVINSNINSILTTSNGSYFSIGGCCSILENSLMENCITDVEFDIGNSVGAKNASYVGGLVAFADGKSGTTTINNCIAISDLDWVKNVTNIDFDHVQTSYTNDDGNIIFGGLVSEAHHRVVITNSFTSGDYDVRSITPNAKRQSVVGGLVACVFDCANDDGSSHGVLEMTNCFSSASIAGDYQDLMAGLVGNNEGAVNITSCHFGGTLLNPQSASIINYSKNGTFNSITYNPQMSPNAVSIDGSVTATTSNVFPNLSSVNQAYYTACTQNLLNFASSTENVSAVTASTTVNPSATTSTVTAGNGFNEYEITLNDITRKVRLIDTYKSGENGNTVPFTVSNATDLSNMQSYVAIGGGYLGAKFNMTADITASLTEPIGMATEGFITVDEENQPFYGCFDGQAHKLTVSSAVFTSERYAGLFGFLKYASVEDLTVEYPSATTISANYSAGGVIGYAEYSKLNGLNVIAANGLTLSSSYNGGIVGYLKTSTINSQDEFTSFTGKLISSSNTGGIVGYAEMGIPSYSLTDTGGGNYSAKNGDYFDAKDITISSFPVTRFENCSTTGDVIGGQTQTGTNASNTAHNVGGIIGYCDIGSYGLTNSFMYGNVSGGVNVGGIIGNLEEVSSLKSNNISAVYTHGNIYANDFAGGIVGHTDNLSESLSIISQGYFAGQIFCKNMFGALTSQMVGFSCFFYDAQVAGVIDVCGDASTEDVAVSYDTLISMVSQANASSNEYFEVLESNSTVDQNDASVYYGANGGSIRFSSSVTVSTSGTAENSWYEHTSQERFFLKNTNDSGWAEFSFTGTDFRLYNYLSGGLDAYRVWVDGEYIDFSNSSPTGVTINNTYAWYQNTLQQQNGVIKYISNSSHGNKTYTTFVNLFSPTPSDSTKYKSIEITGLKNRTHTVKIQATSTKSNSYMNIVGFDYAAKTSNLDSYVNVVGHYPQLSAFNASVNTAVTLISDISTRRLYDFGGTNGSIENNAHAFRPNKTVIETGTGTDYTHDAAEIALAGVTYATATYTNGGTAEMGSFTIIAQTPAVNGYRTQIKEQIIINPFITGTGTFEDPYGIPDVPTLLLFRDYINNVFSGAGQHFKLTMTMENTVDGYIYDLSNTTLNADDNGKWLTPIGNASRPFQGHFHGNNKTVSNLDYSGLTSDMDVNTLYGIGLFGYIGGGTVDNLTIDGAIISVESVENNTTNNKQWSAGALVGVLNAGAITNVSILNSSFDMAYEQNIPYINGKTTYTSVGGVVGRINGFSTLSGILSDCDIDVSRMVTTASIGIVEIGGIAGMVNCTENTADVSFNNCIYVGDINATSVTGKQTRAIAGGIIGQVYSASDAYSIDVTNCASYGTIDTEESYVGGIIGEVSAGNLALKLTVENCSSTMNITAGCRNDSSLSASYHYVGGIMGNVKLAAGVYVMNYCTFAGEINWATDDTTSSRVYIGGIVGKSVKPKKSIYNIFDITKNPDLTVERLSGRTATPSINIASVTQSSSEKAQGVKTYELLDEFGRYTSPELDNEYNFGSVDNLAIVNKIIESNTIQFGVVRTDYTLYSDLSGNGTILTAGEDFNRPIDATSVYVPSNSGATLSILNGNSTNGIVQSISNRRVVATGEQRLTPIKVRIVKLVDGVDQYAGYGKTIEFYPSQKSMGYTDASYAISDPLGDGIETGTANGKYMIYNADQLMGLDVVISGDEVDTTGGKLFDTVSSDVSVTLGNDIIFTPEVSQKLKDIVIGDETHMFTGTFDGNEHYISGMSITSDESAVGLFAKMSGATITDVGIADSAFIGAATGNAFSGSVGSFAGIAENVTVSNSFSSARVEQNNPAPNGVYIGGFFGSTNNLAVSNSYFTGSVGISATDSATYPEITGTGDFYSGGIVGNASGTTSITNSYVASYIHGDENEGGTHNFGIFAGQISGASTLTGCSADYKSVAENSRPVGNVTASASSVTISGGLYPSIWSRISDDTIILSRIVVSYSTSASSLNQADAGYTGADFSNADYYGSTVVYESAMGNKYAIDSGTLTRTDNGLASVILTYNGHSRYLVINLQCWYDNFYIENGSKVYTIKSAAELVELARLVKYGDVIEHIGHSHEEHTGDGIAQNFNGAIIRLGADIFVGTDVEYLESIGSLVNPFNAQFDGNGYTIVNAKFNSSTGIGLFGYVSPTSSVTNVVFAGNTVVEIASGQSSPIYIGLVAGENNGTITNCANGSSVTIDNQSDAQVIFGAIVGKNDSGKTVSGCYNMQHIKALQDNMKLAGIAGENSGTITKCYNTGIIDGYTNESVMGYVSRCITAGISASNSGTVSTCYNAGVIRYYAPNGFYPIADGTVSGCYVDGQVFTPQFNYTASLNGSQYSAGVTMLPTATLVSSLPSGFSADDWENVTGYYPQLMAFSSGNHASHIRSSYVSALATILTNKNVAGTFDSFTKVEFIYGSKAFNILQNPGNSGTFVTATEAGKTTMTVKKAGVAYITLSLESGDITYSRETYFINEAVYKVRYMFDFGMLTADTQQTTQRVQEYAGDTFATNRLGTGTAGNPYLINTAADLDAFADYINDGNGVGRYFKLVNNIVYDTNSYTPVGTQSNPFSGVFNGNGYTISGIQTVDNVPYIGVFGYCNASSTIELLAIDNCRFDVSASQDTWAGSIAGYTDGMVTNCYTRGVVTVNNSNSAICAGGIIGELGSSGSLLGCYARPYNQGADGSVSEINNNLRSFVSASNTNFYAGTLVGKSSGTINGCYHTAVYYSPTGLGYTLAEYGIMVGWHVEGEIINSYYDKIILPAINKYIFCYTDENKYIGEISVTTNQYGKTTAQLKATESSASTNGVANDSAAIELSKDIYLGTYEMTPLEYNGQFSSTRYSNNGYPMLTAFDVLQFTFDNFNASNIIVNMQNIDASNAKFMNSLCSFETYTFPKFADITVKTRLNVNVLSLPAEITYNISSVAYGSDDDSNDIKWVAVEGNYTQQRNLSTHLYEEDGITVSAYAHGSNMMDNTATDGAVSIPTGTTSFLPDNCDRIYIYISLKATDIADYSTWGVFHVWDSSELDEMLLEEETE